MANRRKTNDMTDKMDKRVTVDTTIVVPSFDTIVLCRQTFLVTAEDNYREEKIFTAANK
jgi:hypothetical protein